MEISELDEAELKNLCPEINLSEDRFGLNEDAIAYKIEEKNPDFIEESLITDGESESSRSTNAPQTRRLRRRYWGQVKYEFYSLVCTEDKKYADLRQKLAGQINTTTIVGIISGTIGSALGAAAGIITPLVALLLYGLLKLGKNAWCKCQAPVMLGKAPDNYLNLLRVACHYAERGKLKEAEQFLKIAVALDEKAVKKLAVDNPGLKPLWDIMGGTMWKHE